MSKVDQKAQLHSGCIQIVEHLRAMLIDEIGNGFELDDNLVLANKIRFENFL